MLAFSLSASEPTATLVPTSVTIPTPWDGTLQAVEEDARGGRRAPSPATSPQRSATATPTIVFALTVTPTAIPTFKPSLSPTATANPSGQAALVNRVINGDTIEVEIEGQRYKLQYIGMDMPETKHPQKPEECFGHEATEKNRELVEGKVVYLGRDVSEADRYGCLLRYVYLADGTFVNPSWCAWATLRLPPTRPMSTTPTVSSALAGGPRRRTWSLGLMSVRRIIGF